MPREKVSVRKKTTPRKKATPRIKTQETFEEQVKGELQSTSGTPVASRLKRKNKKDTSLLDDPPKKVKPKKKEPALPRPEHFSRVSELDEIKFDEKKFVLRELSKTLKKGGNGAYIASILYRNMIDYLKREHFYLGNVEGADKTKIKQALQKDLAYVKTLLRSV